MDNEIKKYNVILYTDGSARPNPGSFGGGCHGYLFTDDDYKNNGDKPTNYTVTNNGYLEKHEMTDTDKVIKPSMYYNAIYPYGTYGSNNEAELRAVIDSISIVCDEHSVNNIIIFTDSTYVISVFTAITNTPDKTEWDVATRANINLWHDLYNVLETWNTVDISLRKVTAHGTAIGNNVADRLAYAAVNDVEAGNQLPSFKFYTGKYWKDKPTPHPLLNFKQIYFNTGLFNSTTDATYVIMDYPKDVELGNKSADPIFGISIFKKPVDIVNTVITKYREDIGSDILSVIDLRVLYSQNNHKLGELLGNRIYDIRGRKLRVLEEDTVVMPIQPVGLAKNAVRRMYELYTSYNTHIDNEGIDDGISVTIPITDQLYDINAKGKLIFKYDQTIPGPIVNFKLGDVDRTINFVYGKDILTCNQLKRLGLDKPVISLLCKRCPGNLFEYYFLVETDTVSGVYGNYYTNKIHY